jgi:putative glutamine amidotransferase
MDPAATGTADGQPAGARRPLIAVTGRRFDAGRTFRDEASVAIQAAYLDAVSRSGAVAVLLPPEPLVGHEAAARVDRLDGLVLTGGPDVDPARYDRSAHPTTYGVSALQDAFEVALLRAALARGIPVLAICRGLQVVNVAHGGTLHQHLPDLAGVGPHGVPDGGGGTLNDVTVEPGSLLASVVGDVTTSGMCHHHQAVDEVGAGLSVSARTADGVVEALEPADPDGSSWLLAVQWHPEETAHDHPASQRLFDHLAAAAVR